MPGGGFAGVAVFGRLGGAGLGNFFLGGSIGVGTGWMAEWMLLAGRELTVCILVPWQAFDVCWWLATNHNHKARLLKFFFSFLQCSLDINTL